MGATNRRNGSVYGGWFSYIVNSKLICITGSSEAYGVDLFTVFCCYCEGSVLENVTEFRENFMSVKYLSWLMTLQECGV
jgi:hypothetical protein